MSAGGLLDEAILSACTCGEDAEVSGSGTHIGIVVHNTGEFR